MKSYPESSFLSGNSKDRQDAFITQHYKQLNSAIQRNLGKYYGPDKDELKAQVWCLLVAKISEKAFIDKGWSEDLDCLRQSLSKIRFLCSDVMRKAISVELQTDSYDSLVEDSEEGRAPNIPTDFFESRDPSPEALLISKQLHQAIRACATSDYENAILDWVMGNIPKTDILRGYSVSKDTVTKNRDQLLAKIRLNLIKEGHM